MTFDEIHELTSDGVIAALINGYNQATVTGTVLGEKCKLIFNDSDTALVGRKNPDTGKLEFMNIDLEDFKVDDHPQQLPRD